MFIDTHAHLNFKAFDDDYEKAIERAFRAGVKGIINVGSNYKTSEKAINIAKDYEKGIYAAVGLHPIHVKDEDFDFNKYLELAKKEEVVAIGEMGVDLYHDKTTVDLQRDVFEKSLRIASQVDKPVIIHCREAEEELRVWLMGQRNLPKGVLHCFSGDWEFANFVIDLGFLISFTGIITFTKNKKTLEVIKEIPLEKIMIETDSPFLSPNKYHGERNEPVYVIEVAKKIAEIKKISLGKVEKQTTLNTLELFKVNV